MSLKHAFQRGEKKVAERLLPHTYDIANIRTQYFLSSRIRSASDVSLVHLAAYHGWLDVIDNLIKKYGCNIHHTDSRGHSSLHYAVSEGHLKVVRYLISEHNCNPSCVDKDNGTPLHFACSNGHLNIVQYLIGEVHVYCSSIYVDSEGNTPLHYACSNGHLNIVQYLINKVHVHCDPSRRNYFCDTPLHSACNNGHLNIVQYLINEVHCKPEKYVFDQPLHNASLHGHLNIVQYLINEEHCNPSCVTSIGRTPLHFACYHGHLNIVQFLTSEVHSNPSCVDFRGSTPLHDACSFGHLQIVQYLISEIHCNPSCEDNYCDTPLHLACSSGHLSIVQYLIKEAHCNPSCEKYRGSAPLHDACSNGCLGIVQYLINEVHCDPSCVDNEANTPLHYACGVNHGKRFEFVKFELSGFSAHVRIIQYLLSTNRVDPLAKNNDGKTPLYYASRCYNSYKVLKVFEVFPQCRRDFPVHTYTKVILTGHSGAGKTTISQLILLASRGGSGIRSLLSSGRVTDVEPLTAGIIPLHVESKVKEISNMVIYDFAGQQEYYSSHSAVLERIMRNSAAIFLCLVDLSQCMEKISESVHYWMSFIENACSTAQGSSHVIIVGSHADMIKSHKELKEKNLLVENIAESRVEQLTYGGFVSMDCRLSRTKDAKDFLSFLYTSQQSIQACQPSISLYCHMLYAFLCTTLKKPGCTLQELDTLTSKKDSFFPSDPSVSLSDLLTTLSDKGLIMFIPNQEHPKNSWVVVEKEAFLRKVNGTLFAPAHLKQYCEVASNTGIVFVKTLQELFPQYNTDMLMSCLESMEFCHPVDPSALEIIDLESSKKPLLSKVCHLFFPSLIKENRPDNLSVPRFGWCLGCSDPHQFFSNRFLHVLLLRLAFTFPLASDHLPPSSILHGLERRCQVWRNGISWKSVSGVSTIVEVIDRNRWVIVLVSEKSREAAEICSSVIRMILHLRQELCKVVHVCECLISPSLLDQYPFDILSDTDLYTMRDVARSMLLKHKVILDRKEGKNELLTEKSLCFEPYYLMRPSSVCQLLKTSMADCSIPAPLLREVLRYCQITQQQEPQDLKDLRERVDKHSMFAGRNPLVSSVAVIIVVIVH